MFSQDTCWTREAQISFQPGQKKNKRIGCTGGGGVAVALPDSSDDSLD